MSADEITDLKRRATLGVGWVFVDRTITKIIALAIFLGLTRFLGPRDFGLAAMAKATLALARPFVDQGTGPALVQRGNLENRHRDSAFWLNTASGAFLAVAIAGLAAPIAGLLNEVELRSVLGVLSLQLLVEGLGATHVSLLQRDLSFKPLAVRSVAAEIIGGIVALALAAAGLGVWSLVGQTLARQLADTLMLWLVSPWRPGRTVSSVHARELLGFGYRFMGSRIVSTLSGRLDELLLGGLMGATAVGYYSVAMRFVRELSNLITGSMGEVAFPTFSRLQAHRLRLTQAFYKMIEYTSILAFPAFLGLAVVSPDLIPITVGSTWLASVPILRSLVILGLVGSVGRFNRSLIASSGKPAANIMLNAIDLILGVTAIVAFSEQGIDVVALAYAVSSLASWIVGIWLNQRLNQIQITRYLSRLVLPVAVAGAMTLMLVFLQEGVLASTTRGVRLLILTLAGATTYVGIVFTLRPQLSRELLQLGVLLLPQRPSADLP